MMELTTETIGHEAAALQQAISGLQTRIAADRRFIEQLNRERHPTLYKFASEEIKEMSDALRQKRHDLAILEQQLAAEPHLAE